MYKRNTSYTVRAARRRAAPSRNGSYLIVMLTPAVLGFAAIVIFGALAAGYTP